MAIIKRRNSASAKAGIDAEGGASLYGDPFEKPPGKGGAYAFETKGLRGNGRQGTGSGFDPFNTGANALKYLVPAARLFNNDQRIKSLEKKGNLDIDKVRFYHGIVRDLPKPNLALRSRTPEGSSLSELYGGLKFGDAQQRDAERQYELQNASSRIQQQQQINQSMNQENYVNTQFSNAAKQYNANIANQERFGRIANQEDLELGLTETALNDNNQRIYADATAKAQSASEVLRYGTPGTPEYQNALKYFSSAIQENPPTEPKKFGGKLKRKTRLS